MKTQIKDIVIGIFAVIGFTAVVMGFTNETEPQQTYGTPESHVWEFVMPNNTGKTTLYSQPYLYNKVTGEVRKYNDYEFDVTREGNYKGVLRNKYIKMVEAKVPQ